MNDTLTIVVVIILAGIVMFGLPMISMSERNDDVSQLAVQTTVAEFVNNARNTGKITAADYDKLVTDLYATGNTYDIVMEIQVLDENPGKPSAHFTDGADTKIGENIYYSIYTTQIEEELQAKGYKLMNEGDILTVSASNSNNTVSQMLKNFFYSLSGNDTYSIVGSHSGIVTTTGSAA